MAKNLLKVIGLSTALLFGFSCSNEIQNTTPKYENGPQIFNYTPKQKDEKKQRPTITIPHAKSKTNDVVVRKTIPASKNIIEDSTYHPFSVEEKIMTDEILNSQKENSFDAVGYAGVGISINQIVKSFLPKLNEPLYNFETRAKLPININFEKKVEQPLSLYVERSSNRFEIYLKFKL